LRASKVCPGARWARRSAPAAKPPANATAPARDDRRAPGSGPGRRGTPRRSADPGSRSAQEVALDERPASRSQELAELTEKRKRLHNESDQLCAAHFAALAPTPASTDVRCSRTSEIVEPTGLEPVTPCLQSRCATNCAMAPGVQLSVPAAGPAGS